jgi:hypothetical protein
MWKGSRTTIWSGRRDSNPRPPAPKAGALPDCATPRSGWAVSRLDQLGGAGPSASPYPSRAFEITDAVLTTSPRSSGPRGYVGGYPQGPRRGERDGRRVLMELGRLSRRCRG